MLYEFNDLPVFQRLPRRGKYLRYYLLGVIDSEGCFSVSIKKLSTARFGWVIDPVFTVTQHVSNRVVLELLRRVLNCGRIIKKHGQSDTLVFVIDNRRQLRENLLSFLEKYKPIIKARDFEGFRDIILLLEEKKHYSFEGFRSLVDIAFSMNLEGKQRRYSKEQILKTAFRKAYGRDPQRLYAEHP